MVIKDDELYIVCECGHIELVDCRLFARILGAAVSIGGYFAWTTFLFAGTGFAMPICIAIIAGGVALAAYSDIILPWINKKYSCEKCGRHNWKSMTGSEYKEFLKNKEAQENINELNNQNQDLKEDLESEKASKEIFDTISTIKVKQSKMQADIYNIFKLLTEYENKEKEQEIEKLKQELENSFKALAKQPNNVYLDSDGIKDKFEESLSIAEKELDIMVPFFGYVFKSQNFMLKINSLLNKGVKIRIRYGIGNEIDDNHQNAEELKKKFISDYRIKSFHDKKQIQFFRDNNHSKLILVDNKYLILGSMNVLSNSGESYYNKKLHRTVDKWEELAIQNFNPLEVENLRKQHFDF